MWMASLPGPECGPDRTAPVSGRSVNVMSMLFIFLSFVGNIHLYRLFVDVVIYRTGERTGLDRTDKWSECDSILFIFLFLLGSDAAIEKSSLQHTHDG